MLEIGGLEAGRNEPGGDGPLLFSFLFLLLSTLTISQSSKFRISTSKSNSKTQLQIAAPSPSCLQFNSDSGSNLLHLALFLSAHFPDD